MMRATASLRASQYLPTRQLSSPRACNALFLMVCILLCGIIAVTAQACQDNRAGFWFADSGCTVLPYTICVTGSPSDGSGATGNGCAFCIDSAAGGNQDTGCDAGSPVCSTGAASTGGFSAGTSCGACIDSDSGSATDDGCSSKEDDVFGNVPAPICFDREYSNANYYAGSSVVPLEQMAVASLNQAFNACTPCVDSDYSTDPDHGCPSDHPFCVDVSRWEDNFFHNDGDSGRGLLCAECVNNEASLQSGSTDEGCAGDAPYCYSYRRWYYGVKMGSVSAARNEGLEWDEPGYCVACIDTSDEAGVDQGCSPENPLCVTTGTTESDLLAGFVISQTHECFKCKNESDSSDIDIGCTEQRPFCSNVDPVHGHGTACGTVNHNCVFLNYFPDEGASPNCTTPYIVDVAINLTLADCTSFDLDLPRIKAAINDSLLGRPECAVTIMTGLVSNSSGSSGTSRHLLQGGTPGQVALAVSAYVDSNLAGTTLRDLLQSPSATTTIVDIIEEIIGTVMDIDVEAVLRDLSSVVSDPHFTTATGQRFDFNGIAGHSYCILTDKQVHVSAHFMGAVDSKASAAGSQPDYRTWMDQISIMHGNDRILIDAMWVPGSAYAVSFGTVRINGEPLLGRTAMKKLPSGTTVSRSKTRVLVSVPGLLVAEVEVIRAAFWEAGAGPGANFLNLQIKQFNGTPAAHGILGQSYSRQSEGAAFEGSAEDYASTGIFANDCRFNQFANDK
eukprot:jgi/Mesvir1/14552/Mv05235-RA.5